MLQPRTLHYPGKFVPTKHYQNHSKLISQPKLTFCLRKSYGYWLEARTLKVQIEKLSRLYAVAGFDVHFDAYAKQHVLITDHTNRGFVSVLGGFLNITYNELLNFEG